MHAISDFFIIFILNQYNVHLFIFLYSDYSDLTRTNREIGLVKLFHFCLDCSDFTRTTRTLLGLETARTRTCSDFTRTSLGQLGLTLLGLRSDSWDFTWTARSPLGLGGGV